MDLCDFFPIWTYRFQVVFLFFFWVPCMWRFGTNDQRDDDIEPVREHGIQRFTHRISAGLPAEECDELACFSGDLGRLRAFQGITPVRDIEISNLLRLAHFPPVIWDISNTIRIYCYTRPVVQALTIESDRKRRPSQGRVGSI